MNYKPWGRKSKIRRNKKNKPRISPNTREIINKSPIGKANPNDNVVSQESLLKRTISDNYDNKRIYMPGKYRRRGK